MMRPRRPQSLPKNITSTDAGIACWDSKYAYWAILDQPGSHATAPLDQGQRVSELLAEREKIHGQATAAAIERVASVISGTEKVGKINMLAAQAMAI